MFCFVFSSFSYPVFLFSIPPLLFETYYVFFPLLLHVLQGVLPFHTQMYLAFVHELSVSESTPSELLLSHMIWNSGRKDLANLAAHSRGEDDVLEDVVASELRGYRDACVTVLPLTEHSGK